MKSKIVLLLMLATVNLAHASEVTGSLSTSQNVGTSTSGTISGNVSGGSVSSQSINNGGGGGGGFVIPALSYSLGGSGGNQGQVLGASTYNPPTTPNYTGIGGEDLSGAGTPRRLAQTGSDETLSPEQATTTATITETTVPDTTVTPINDTVSQNSMFDFFGISMWFWLVLLLLILLIGGIAYMQSL